MARFGEVAEWVGVDVTASADDAKIERVSGLNGAGVDAVVFAVDADALADALKTGAGMILANRKLKEQTADPRVLWVADARHAFAVAAKRLAGKGFHAGVHPRAVIGDGVMIGEGSWVGPGSVLADGVSIGRDCNLVANVAIYTGTVLGDRVVAQAGVVLGSTGFGYARSAETGEYVIFP